MTRINGTANLAATQSTENLLSSETAQTEPTRRSSSPSPERPAGMPPPRPFHQMTVDNSNVDLEAQQQRQPSRMRAALQTIHPARLGEQFCMPGAKMAQNTGYAATAMGAAVMAVVPGARGFGAVEVAVGATAAVLGKVAEQWTANQARASQTPVSEPDQSTTDARRET